MKYGLYVITDESLSNGLTHTEIARMAIAGGADVIQLRDKHLSGRDLMRYAVDIRSITRDAGVLFIVNDRLDIALACDADGVHLGQEDMPLKYARRIAPPGFIIGISASNAEEAIAAEREGADYIGFGPVYSTRSKSDARPACGLDSLRNAKSSVSIPIVAIGGIGMSNIRDVLRAGADGIAVISAVVSQDDVVAAAQDLKAIINESRNSSKNL